jgi:hypothetical protein
LRQGGDVRSHGFCDRVRFWLIITSRKWPRPLSGKDIMAKGFLHGISEKGITADAVEVGLERARSIDPIKGTGDITVLQTDSGTVVGRTWDFSQEPYRPGIITDFGPNGEDDLDAPMYWVKLAYQPGSDPATPLNVQPSEFGQYYIVPVTNIKEFVGGDKNLDFDDVVNVFIWHDHDGNYRFYIDTAPGVTKVKPGKLKTAWAPGNSTVTLVPCFGFSDPTPDGNPDVVAQIHIPSSAPPCFQPVVGAILGYLRFPDPGSGSMMNVLVSPPLLPVPTHIDEVVANAAATGSAGHYVAKYITVHA